MKINTFFFDQNDWALNNFIIWSILHEQSLHWHLTGTTHSLCTCTKPLHVPNLCLCTVAAAWTGKERKLRSFTRNIYYGPCTKPNCGMLAARRVTNICWRGKTLSFQIVKMFNCFDIINCLIRRWDDRIVTELGFLLNSVKTHVFKYMEDKYI